MADEILGADEIDAAPTKSFFIDMLTRDIPLDQAILDLIDNSVDGAKALREVNGGNFSDLWVKLEFGHLHQPAELSDYLPTSEVVD